MKYTIRIRKWLKWLLAAVIAVLIGAAAVFMLARPQKAVTAEAKTSTTFVAELWDKTNKKFNLDNLNKVAELSGYANISAMVNDSTLSTTPKTATYMKDVILKGEWDITLGGIKWMPVYLSKSNAGTTNGHVVLTLYQSDDNGTSTFTEDNTSYSNDASMNPPSNTYGSSYIRAVTLNNGGYYYENYSGSTQPTRRNYTALTSGNVYAPFTTGTTGDLKDYLVAPNNMGWQKSENQYANDLSFTGNANYTDTTSGPHHLNWGNDKIWLPSVYEVYNTSWSGTTLPSDWTSAGKTDGGLWKLSQNQQQHTQTWSWLRSAYPAGYRNTFVLRSSGTLNNSVVYSSRGVRPALHLDLTSAAGAAGETEVEAPSDLSDQVFNPAYSKTPTAALEGGSTWYANNKNYVDITCQYTNPSGGTSSLNMTSGTVKNAGTYTFTAKPKSGNNWKDGTAASDGKTFTFKITQKSVTADMIAAIAAQTYTGSQIKPSPTVKDGTATMAVNTDYTVTYGANVLVSSGGTVTIEGKGNYTGTATKSFTISAKEVTVSGITVQERAYDGDTSATLKYTNVSVTGAYTGDTLTVTATGTFTDKNVGDNKTVNISNITLSGTHAANYTVSSGSQKTASGKITKATITMSITDTGGGNQGGTIKAPTYTLSGVFNNETVDVTFTYTSRGDNGKSYNSTEIPPKTGNYIATASISNGNYTLSTAGNTNQCLFTVGAAANAITKFEAKGWVYGKMPASTADIFTVEASFGADTATFTYCDTENGNFTSDVPEDAGTYWVKADIAATPLYGAADKKAQLTITKSVVTISGDLNRTITKEYDGTTACGELVRGTDYFVTATGKVPTQDVLTITSKAYDHEDVLSALKIAVTFALGDTDNYELSGTGTINLGGKITPKPVTVSGITADEKVYDGKTKATLVFSGANIAGKLDEDTLNVTATGNFADKNVGNGKTVNLSGLTLTGAAAGNYKLAESGNQTTTTANITPKAITVTGISAENKQYDGETSATLKYTSVSLAGKVEGDTLTVTATGTYDSSAVGTGKTVAISDITLGGADAGNYKLAESGNQTETTAAITKKQVTVKITAGGGVFNGEITPASATLNGLVGDDSVAITLTYSKDGTDSTETPTAAGTYTVTATIPADGNYELTGTNTASFVISAAANSITAFTAEGWTYGGTAEEHSATATFGTPVITYSSEENGTYSATKPVNAGTYWAKAAVEATDSYAAAEQKKQFVISPKNITVSITEGGGELSGEITPASATLEGVVDGDDVAVTLTYTSKGGYNDTKVPSELGVYTVTASIDNANYILTGSVTGRFEIVAKFNKLTAFTADGWTYGGTVPEHTATADYGTPVITYSTEKDGTYTATKPVNAGTYWAKAEVEATAEYGSAIGYLEFTIAKSVVTVTVKDGAVVSKEYDGTAACSNLTAGTHYELTATGGVPSDEVLTVTAEFNAATVADANQVAATFTLSDLDNYELTEGSGSLTFFAEITRKQITVTINKVSTDKGKPLSTLSATVKPALVEGDTDDEVYSLSTGADSESAGQYDITGTALDDNYQIKFVGGSKAYWVKTTMQDNTGNGNGSIDIPSEQEFAEFTISSVETGKTYGFEGLSVGYRARLWVLNEDGETTTEYVGKLNDSDGNCRLTFIVPDAVGKKLLAAENLDIENDLKLYVNGGANGEDDLVTGWSYRILQGDKIEVSFEYSEAFAAEVVFNAPKVEPDPEPATTTVTEKEGIPWWVWLIVGVGAAAIIVAIIVMIVVRKKKTAAIVQEYDDSELKEKMDELLSREAAVTGGALEQTLTDDEMRSYFTDDELASMVADGRISQEDADRIKGGRNK